MTARRATYLDLGVIPYGVCRELQLELFDALVAGKSVRTNGEVAEKEAEQYLLLCEHPPVYTLGRSGDEGNMLVGEEFLRGRGAEFHRIERGGDITFHGPGQLVGYPILDLEKEGMGLRDYIYTLEQTVIDTVAEYGIAAGRIEGAAGVWLTDDRPLRKICAIGVRASRYVTMHGFALNANTDLEWFGLINPCGFTDRGVTSIEKEAGAPVDMERLKSLFVSIFERKFDIKINTEDYAYRKTLGYQAAGRRAQSG